MSLKWDDIDTRQQQKKQQERELKAYLMQQQQDVKKRKQKEKEDDRQIYRQHVFGKVNQDAQKQDPMEEIETKNTKPIPITTQANNLNSSISRDFVDDRYRAVDDTLLETNFRLPDSDWQSGKYLMGTMSAKIEQLQDQAKREREKIHDLSQSFYQKERESRDVIESLTKRLDQESEKVQRLLHDLSKQHQRNDTISMKKDSIIQSLQNQIEQLAQKVEQFSLIQNQAGQNISHTAKELVVETQRNQDAIRTIKKHEMQLTTLSNNLDSNSESFARRMQMAAQDLVQKIENESKSRRKLEESIRSDAMEFRRVIERHVAERVESLHSYTSAKQEADRQEFESIAVALQSKLQRLEATSVDGQEQLISMLNQRFQIIESGLIETEKSIQKSESRMQQGMTASFEVFEALIVKKDTEGEKRLKEIIKNMMQMQNAMNSTIELSEKSIQAKIKSLEEVLRAEIKARMETDSAINSLGAETKVLTDGAQNQIDKLQILTHGLQKDHEKVLDLVKGATQQMTKSQDRWIANFEGEIVRVNDTIKKQSDIFSKSLDNFKSEFEVLKEDFSNDLDQKLNSWVVNLNNQSEKIDSLEQNMKSIEQGFGEKHQDYDQKLIARSIQFDSTLEAMKIELGSRPTHEAFENRLEEFRIDIDMIRADLTDEVDNLKKNISDKPNSEDSISEFENKVHIIKSELTEHISSMQNSINDSIEKIRVNDEQDREMIQKLHTQFGTIVENHDTLDEAINQHSFDIYQLKIFQNDTASTAHKFELEFQNFKKLMDEVNDQISQAKLVHEETSNRLTRLSDDIVDRNASMQDNLNRQIQNTNSQVANISETIYTLKAQAEKSILDQKIQMKDLLNVTIANQKQAIQDVNKKIHDLINDFQIKNDASNKAISKIANAIDATNGKVDRELDSIHEELKDVQTRQENEEESIKNLDNQISTAFDEAQLAIQEQTGILDSTKRDVEDLASKINHQDNFFQNQMNEIAESVAHEANEFANQIKVIHENMARAKQLNDQRVKDVNSKCDQNNQEIRNLKLKQSKLISDTSSMQSSLQRHGRFNNEQDEKGANYVKPLVEKMDLLVDHLKFLEESIEQVKHNREFETPKYHKNSPGTIFKPNFKSQESSKSGTISKSVTLNPTRTESLSFSNVMVDLPAEQPSMLQTQESVRKLFSTPPKPQDSNRNITTPKSAKSNIRVSEILSNLPSQRTTSNISLSNNDELHDDSISRSAPRSRGEITNNRTEQDEKLKFPLLHTPSSLEF